jgi:hypothetical protein
MPQQEQIGNLDPSQISVDEQGRLVIDNPILSAAIRRQLSSNQPAAAPDALRASSGLNIIACGNHCARLD